MSEWDVVYICGLWFQWASTININLSIIVWYKADIVIILLKIKLFTPWFSWGGIKQQSLTHSYLFTVTLNWSTWHFNAKYIQFDKYKGPPTIFNHNCFLFYFFKYESVLLWIRSLDTVWVVLEAFHEIKLLVIKSGKKRDKADILKL